MHYRDGTPARVGDKVRGTGYNVKGADGKPAEIDGIVVGLTPGAETCNIEVAHPRAYPTSSSSRMAPAGSPGIVQIVAKGTLTVDLSIEYGECAAFDYVGPRTDDRFKPHDSPI